MNRRDISAPRSLENVSHRTKWSAAVFAGFTGALAFFVWQILMMWLTAEQPPWTTVRLIASVALGEEGARAPIDFDLLLTAVAAAVHFGLSIGFACLVAPLLRDFTRIKAVVIGLLFGVAIFVVDFYVLTPAFFPWMAEMRTVVTFIGHLIFGLTVAGVYGLAQGALRKSIDLPAEANSR
jgi:hypothetical protein